MDPNRSEAENPPTEPTPDQVERRREHESDIDEQVAKHDKLVEDGEMESDVARELYLMLDEKKHRG